MNIKKYSLKAMCAALACTTVLSSMLAAYATDVIINETPMDDLAEINTINALSDDSAGTGSSDSGWTTEENSFEDIKVTYQQSSSYAVTIPKTIALDTKKQAVYSVKVSGDIDTNQRVYVAPVDGISDSENLDFHMKDLSGKKADVVATVTQNKTYWGSEDVANAYEETQNCVSAPDLTAGTWEGTFQVEIRLETEKVHEHNYVDGVCTECGEKDPNASHEHNYVDGKCTICGNKCDHNWQGTTCTICGATDAYAVAPANEYNKWNYTLDDENNIITLNYYKQSEANVIVYANYPIGEKTYKTQIASNSDDATMNTPYMFNAYNRTDNYQTIRFSKNIDTSNVTNMKYMFCDCQKLTSLDIEGFDTSNVTDMSYMFYLCKSFTYLHLGHFDTSNVTKMMAMFNSCKNLYDLDISSFDTSNVTDMASMFAYCESLTSLDLSHFDTSNVTNMTWMFAFDYKLNNLNLSSFNTSNVTNMSSMFCQCKTATSLDLSSFDTNQTTDMSNMFIHALSLKTVYATEGKWSTSQANVSGMFSDCGTSSVTYK